MDSDIFIVVYNGLASRRSSIIGIPVAFPGQYQVTSVDLDRRHLGQDEEIMTSAVLSQTKSLQISTIVYFDTGPLPPVGAKVYRLKIMNSFEGKVDSESSLTRVSALLRGKDSDGDLVQNLPSFQLSNGFMNVRFNR